MSATTSRSSRVRFTTRGASVLSAGVATVIGAILLGETDLLRIAVAVIMLCLLCWVYLKLSRLRLHTRHLAIPDEAAVGSAVTVQVPLRISHRLIVVDLVTEDETSAGLTDPPRLGVDPQAARSSLTVQYRTSTHHRGIHHAGGTRATMRDPFGIAEITVRTSDQATILGLPRTHPVDSQWLRTASPDDGREHAGSVTRHSEPDVDIRDHRAEDGLRRVHWRTSARLGKLMVRPDEPVEDRADLIVLDTRSSAHFGHSFESLVEIAASVGRALLEAGHTVELRTWHGTTLGQRAYSDPAPLLRALAVLEPSTDEAPIEPADITRSPTLSITTESTDLTTIARGRRPLHGLTVVLTHRAKPRDGNDPQSSPSYTGMRVVHHSTRESVSHLLARPPVDRAR